MDSLDMEIRVIYMHLVSYNLRRKYKKLCVEVHTALLSLNQESYIPLVEEVK